MLACTFACPRSLNPLLPLLMEMVETIDVACTEASSSCSYGGQQGCMCFLLVMMMRVKCFCASN